MVDYDELLHTLRDFAFTMASDDYEMVDVLLTLGDAVNDILGVVGTGTWLVSDDGRMQFLLSTSGRVTEVERVQERTQDGPAVAAQSSQAPVVVAELDGEARWGEYAEAARSAGLSAVLALPLSQGDHRLGALDIYDESVREWTEAELDAATLLAQVATGYIVHASKLDHYRRLTEQLQRALDSRVVIEQAKGRVSGSRGVTGEEAFAAIRRHARTSQRPVRDVASDVVEGRLDLGVDGHDGG